MRTTCSRLALSVVALSCAGLLSACGGSATVEGGTGTGGVTSIAPLDRGGDNSVAPSAADGASGAASASAQPGGAGNGAGVGNGGNAEPTARDEGAHEISSVPAPAPAEETEAKFLEALGKAGINVEGAEDQLIGAGLAVCGQGNDVTVAAAAGQIIAQGRTQLDHGATVKALADAARGALCQ